MQRQTIRLIVVAAASLLFGMIAAQLILMQQEKKPVGIPSIGGDFTLQSSKGPVNLLKDLKGKVIALYFGFASCPDICPTSLGQLAAALRQLDAAEQKQIQSVFVSVDPERDDVQKLAIYANAFYPGMLGLTDSKDVIDDVTWRYRSLYKTIPMEDSAIGYTIDHTSIIYIIGRNGVLHSLAQHGTTTMELIEKLRMALKET